MTKDLSFPGAAHGPADGISASALSPCAAPPGPASAKPGPKKFASVIEQAMKRKALVPTAGASSSKRSAPTPSPDSARAKSVRIIADRRSKPGLNSEFGIQNSEFDPAPADVNCRKRTLPARLVDDLAESESETEAVEAPPTEENQEGDKAASAYSGVADTQDTSANTATRLYADVLANIVAFPGLPAAQSVIIPFPLGAAHGGAAHGASASATSPTAGANDSEEVGEGKILQLPSAGSRKASEVVGASGVDVAELGLKPVEQPEEMKELSLMGQADEGAASQTPASPGPADGDSAVRSTSVVSVIFRQTGSAEFRNDSGEQGENAEPQLPDVSDLPEESAHPAQVLRTVGSPTAGVSRGFESAQAPVHTGFPHVQNLPSVPGPADGDNAGTTAARQESRMESFSNSERGSAAAQGAAGTLEEFQPGAAHGDNVHALLPAAGAARNLVATEWQLGDLRSAIVLPTAGRDSSSAPPVDASATVERISKMLMVETALVRKHGSDAMAVVLRPDAETELFVHFTQRNGQVEATIRCERGDAQHLSALWPQLQESLAQQKVRLAPLQDSPSNHSNFSAAHGDSADRRSGEDGSPRQSPRDKQSMDEWPAPASSHPDTSHVRGRGGSRHRRVTISRPGWETWA